MISTNLATVWGPYIVPSILVDHHEKMGIPLGTTYQVDPTPSFPSCNWSWGNYFCMIPEKKTRWLISSTLVIHPPGGSQLLKSTIWLFNIAMENHHF
jgi:hypothetical protein